MRCVELATAFARLSTPLIRDACLRLGVRYDVMEPGVVPRVRHSPVRHLAARANVNVSDRPFEIGPASRPRA